MEKEKSKNKCLIVAFIIILFVAILGLSGTLYFYKNSFKKDNCNVNNNINNADNADDTKFMEIVNKFDFGNSIDTFSNNDLKNSLYIFLEQYLLNTLPIHRDEKGHFASYDLNDLGNDEKNIFVWDYVFEYGYNNNTEYFLQKFLGKDYKIEEFIVYDNFILKKENNKFVATTKIPTEVDSGYIYRITDCNIENDKLIISFDSFVDGYLVSYAYSGEATFKLDRNTLYLEKVYVN